MKTLAIIGAGGHAQVMLDAVRAQQRYKNIVFLDDGNPAQREFMGCPLAGGSEQRGLSIFPDTHDFIVAIGNNAVRRRLQNEWRDAGFTAATVVHPSAIVSPYSRIGEGCAVFARAVVNAFAEIGDGAIINTAAVVEHDCSIGEFAHISPGACLAGNTVVGAESWVGIGAVTRQGVQIGERCTVGAGAAVVGNFSDGLTLVGVPAKPLAKT